MELHQALSDLARDHGQALFRDPVAFRGALDDYLDEGTASGGTINLLTDAVRLGALDSMLTMLSSGAAADDAVESAGTRLARDRGSTDTRGCQWACAVLGHALGRVPVGLVAGLDPEAGTSSPPEPPAPTQVRPQPSPPQPSPGATSWPPPASPAANPSAPAQWPAPAAGSVPPAGPSGGWAPPGASYPAPGTAPRKSKTGLIVAAAVLAVVVLIGGVALAVALSGGDDDDTAADDATSASSDATDGGEVDETEATDGSSPTEDVTPTGPSLDGTGYTIALPSDEWIDGTDLFIDFDPSSTASLDRVALWGETINTSRANVIIEASSASGSTDPEDLSAEWRTALTSSDPTASLTEIATRDIGGQSAIGVEITRTNAAGVEIFQQAYLVISGGNAYSIALSRKADDDGVDPQFELLLGGWSWDE